MQGAKDDYTVSTDKGKLDVDYVRSVLSGSYWAEGISKEVVQRSIAGSLCFGIYRNQKQIGFARVITDEATFAYLCDVFVDEACRGQGAGKRLMEAVTTHPALQGLRRFMLATKDAHGLYARFGFSPLTFTDRWMHVHKPDVYKSGVEPESFE